MTIGPKMQLAVEIVRENPGCSKKFVAEIISPHPHPHKNWALGYDPVNRAIKRGLIKVFRYTHAYALYAVDQTE